MINPLVNLNCLTFPRSRIIGHVHVETPMESMDLNQRTSVTVGVGVTAHRYVEAVGETASTRYVGPFFPFLIMQKPHPSKTYPTYVEN